MCSFWICIASLVLCSCLICFLVYHSVSNVKVDLFCSLCSFIVDKGVKYASSFLIDLYHYFQIGTKWTFQMGWRPHLFFSKIIIHLYFTVIFLLMNEGTNFHLSSNLSFWGLLGPLLENLSS